MEKEIHKQTRMIASVSEALAFRRKNPAVDNELVLKHISKFILSEKDDMTKIGMIASAAKALEITERTPSLKDREVIRLVMSDLGNIMSNIGKEE